MMLAKFEVLWVVSVSFRGAFIDVEPIAEVLL